MDVGLVLIVNTAALAWLFWHRLRIATVRIDHLRADLDHVTAELEQLTGTRYADGGRHVSAGGELPRAVTRRRA